jgi:hypothetical protein
MNPSPLTERTETESEGMATNTIVTVQKTSLTHACEVESVSSNRTNMNGEQDSEDSSTDDRGGNHIPDAPPRPNVMPFEVLVDSNCGYKHAGTSKSIKYGPKKSLDDQAKSKNVPSPPITMSVNDFTAELTASETSMDTKNHKYSTTILDCDVGFDDPPLPNEIPRYIYIRAAKKSSDTGPSAHGPIEAPPSKYPKLNRLLRRWHRPSQIREIFSDSDSEVVCSTLISL